MYPEYYDNQFVVIERPARRMHSSPDWKMRVARQGTGTVYRQLITRGFSDDMIKAALAKADPEILRSIHLTSFNCELGGDPVIGIAYTGDYRSEEEWGLASISKNIAKAEGQTTLTEVQEIDGTKLFAIYENFGFGRSIDENVNRALTRHNSPLNDTGDAFRLTVAEMRAKLKGIVSPLPKNRDECEKAYASAILGLPIKNTQSIGEFHHGGTLVMVTDEPILLAVLEILFEDSVTANALAYDSTGNPFSSAACFYDSRDLTNEEVALRAVAKKWYEDRMNEVKDAVTALKAAGALYAIKPARMKSIASRPNMPAGDYYFINYYYRGNKDCFGWYTLDELFKIASGEVTREDLEEL